MAHFHCGMLFGDLKRNDESVAAYRRALQLDPVSTWNNALAGLYLWAVGHEEEGKQQLQNALELDPSCHTAWIVLAQVHCHEGKFEEATAEAMKALGLSGDLPVALGRAAYVLARAGRQAEALSIAGRLEELARPRYVPETVRAWCYLGLGDYERVFEWPPSRPPGARLRPRSILRGVGGAPRRPPPLTWLTAGCRDPETASLR